MIIQVIDAGVDIVVITAIVVAITAIVVAITAIEVAITDIMASNLKLEKNALIKDERKWNIEKSKNFKN